MKFNKFQRNRPATTLPEIVRKIQTLRTQFGQEVNKIEKSQSLDEDLIYKPKIWWFSHLEWIGDFMKTRTDSTPLSVKAKGGAKVKPEETKLFEFADESDAAEEHFSTEIELSEYDTEATDFAEPVLKKQKTYEAPKSSRDAQSLEKRDDSGIRTIEYTLINEDTTELVPSTCNKTTPRYVEYDMNIDSNQIEKHKRRSKAFGKFVAALLMDITDDNLFFNLQKNITSCIHDANLKQHELKKS